MTVLLTVAGTVLLVGVTIDVIATAVSAGRPGGWMTRRLGIGLWRSLRSSAHNNHAVLQAGGLAIVMLLIVVWLATLLLGWWLVLLALGEVHDGTGSPATAIETLYYAGYTMSTMGNGEFVPTSDVGRILTVGASFNGLFVVTLAITYLVPVLAAVADRRRVAATIHALGPTPAELVQRLWVDDDPGTTAVKLGLAADLRMMAQQHHSYPILHFFHSRHRRTAVAPTVAALDEALRAAGGRGTDVSDHLLESSITDLLAVLKSTFLDVTDTPLPSPVDHDHPTSDSEERRRLLHAFCRDDGWSWTDVQHPTPGSGTSRAADGHR